MIEGTFVLTDGASGKKSRLVKGDVFFIPDGSTSKFTLSFLVLVMGSWSRGEVVWRKKREFGRR